MRNTQTTCNSFRDELRPNLKQVAKDRIYSFEFWFRKKYNLSPKDPAFLNCENWELELDFELYRAFDEAANALQNICPKCKKVIIGNICPTCKAPVQEEKYYDPDWEDYAEKVEAENEEFFKELEKPENWTEVTDDEGIGNA